MKIDGDILYIPQHEFCTACGINASMFEVAAGLGNIQIQGVHIIYNTLAQNYKDILAQKYGDIFSYARSYILMSRLELTQKDKEALDNYLFDDGTSIPGKQLGKYREAAKWLNLLANIERKEITEMGFRDMPAFWELVCGIIENNGIALPHGYRKLVDKIKRYKTEGAVCVVNGRINNMHATKVNSDEESFTVLLEILAHPNQINDQMVLRMYNAWAEKHERKIIKDVKTISKLRKDQALWIDRLRYGDGYWRNKYDKVIHRERPSCPLLLINSDDNHLDLYFQEKRKGGTYYYKRFVLMVVIDCFNSYPLGYSFGDAPSAELVEEAYRNALRHVYELTGEWVLWHQIQTDRYQLKRLKPFYSAQAHFTPTQQGNARGKVIEQTFGTNWHNTLKLFGNYAGHNITAKEKMIALAERDVKKFPDVSQAPEMIARFFSLLRMTPNKVNGKTRQQDWLDAYAAMPVEQKKMISFEERLQLFGRQHDYLNEVTNRGLTISVNGFSYIYDVPDDVYRMVVTKKVRTWYDPADMSAVLASTPDGRIKFTASSNHREKMALADQVEGDRTRLNGKLIAKKQLKDDVRSVEKERKRRLAEVIDMEGLLQGNLLDKEARYQAETIQEYTETSVAIPEIAESLYGEFDPDYFISKALADI